MYPKLFFFFSLFFILSLLFIPQTFAANCSDYGQFSHLCTFRVDDNTTLIRDVIQALFVIAGLAALFFLLYGGIKWILSSGDKAKIGEARAMIVAAIVGLIITFLSFFFISVVSAFFGIKGGTIFVIPQLTNEKPSLPINTQQTGGGNSNSSGTSQDEPGLTE